MYFLKKVYLLTVVVSSRYYANFSIEPPGGSTNTTLTSKYGKDGGMHQHKIQDKKQNYSIYSTTWNFYRDCCRLTEMGRSASVQKC